MYYYDDHHDRTSHGCNILLVAQIVLIILKLFDLINWEWWKVFIPLYINVALLILVGMITIICYIARR